MRDPQWSKVVLAMPMLGPNNGVAFYDLKGHPCTTQGNAKFSTTAFKYAGSSAAFDGTGDYVQLANDPAWDFGSGDFTIEAWVYPTVYPTNPAWAAIVSTFSDGDLAGWRFLINSTGKLHLGGISGGGASTLSVPLGAWTHVAVSRSSGVVKQFVGGVESGSFSNLVINIPTTTLKVGSSNGTDWNFTGYIEDLRITKGYAKYTATFTPPAAALGTGDLYWDNVILALGGQGVHDFKGKSITNVGATVSSTRSRWSGNSIYFNGTSAYLTCNTVCAALVGNPDFTIEGWFYQETVQGGQNTLFSFHDSTGANRLVVTYVGLFGGTGNTIPAVAFSETFVTLGAWVHVAVTHKAGVLTFFKNGKVLAKYSNCQPNIVGTDTFSIGQEYDGASATDFFKGNLNDFRVTLGVARYTENFILPGAHPDSNVLDASFASNVLLLHGNGTDNAQNHTFIDSSAPPKAISRFGDTVQGTFSPFPVVAGQEYDPLVNLGSLYLDGTGDYLRPAANAAFTLGTGDFTLEFWAYRTANGLDKAFFTIPFISTGSHMVGVRYQDANLGLHTNTGMLFTTNNCLPLNTWTHIAVSRASGVNSLFVNGVLQVSGTNTLNYTGDQPYVGADYDGTGWPTGYMADVHIIKGRAKYTAPFAAPTAPAEPVVSSDAYASQVVLLMSMDGTENGTYFSDAAGKSVTRVGTPTTRTGIKKYGTASAYFTSSISNYLTVPASSDWVFSGDFTLECWLFIPVSMTGVMMRLMGTDGGGGAGWELHKSAGDSWNFYDGNSWPGVGGVTFDVWNHFAVSRTGTTIRMFLNGVQVTSWERGVSIGTGGTLYIGRDINGDGGGTFYLDDLRITKGVGRYTATFTTTENPDIANTILLLKNTNAGIRDETGKNSIILRGDTKVRTTQSKFGGSSIYLNGSSGGMFIPHQTANVLGLADFTIEFWFFPITGGRSGAVQDTRLFNAGNNSTLGGMCITCYYDTNPTKIGVYTYSTGYTELFVSPVTIPNDTWSHVALCRVGTTWSLFINGMMTNQATLSFNISQTVGNYIGTSNQGVDVVNGYLDDYRITLGVARYNSASFNSQAFTPPARSMMSIDTRTFSGTITDTEPGSKAHKVRLYERSNGQLVAETTSDPVTGVYSVTVDSAEQHTVLFLDETGRNALVRDLVSGA